MYVPGECYPLKGGEYEESKCETPAKKKHKGKYELVPSGGSVSGNVTEEGNPVEGAIVSVCKVVEDAEPNECHNGITNKQGAYKVSVPPGEYLPKSIRPAGKANTPMEPTRKPPKPFKLRKVKNAKG